MSEEQGPAPERRSDAKVIAVDFRRGEHAHAEVLLTVDRQEITGCGHRHQVIDETLRVIRCKDCDSQLDPIEVMLGWARNWGRYADSVQWLANEKKRLEEELARVKREVANARAQLRRATAPAAAETHPDPKSGP